MRHFSLNLLSLPVWWYSVGLGLFWGWYKKHIFFGLHKTGILLFARHINEPIYGDYTTSGKILSFFLRLFVLLYKISIFSFRVLLLSVLGIGYVFWLPTIIAMIILQTYFNV